MQKLDLWTILQAKEHVIWDWNGTLLNDVDHAVSTVNKLLREHSLPPLDRSRYQQVFEFPVRNYYDALGFDYAKESFESLCHRFVDSFMAGVHKLPLVENMENVLRGLQARGVKQSVLSATDQPNLDQMISHFGLRDIFSHVFGIDNKLAGSKVERGHELMRIAQVDAAKTILVGDTLHDLEVAKAIGIEALLLGHGHQCPAKLSCFHDQVIIPA